MDPIPNLLERAELVLISVVTIGAQMDEHIRALNKFGQILESYLFDSIGVVALSKVGKAVRRLAETEADSRGWGVGDALGPGSLKGWPIEEQMNLCTLLPLKQINVKLHGYLSRLVSEPEVEIKIVEGTTTS